MYMYLYKDTYLLIKTLRTLDQIQKFQHIENYEVNILQTYKV